MIIMVTESYYSQAISSLYLSQEERIKDNDEHLTEIYEEYNKSQFKGLLSFGQYINFILSKQNENHLYSIRETLEDIEDIIQTQYDK